MSEMKEKLVFNRPESVIDRPTHYCPGCHHGIAHRLIGELLDELNLGQVTTTTPGGRCQTHEGAPIRMTEIIASLGGVAFAARGSLDSVANIKKAKKYLKKAFEFQLNNVGFGFVELLSGCPTNWRMTPLKANERIQNEMIPYFPLGIYKDVSEEGGVC